jgi:hypothetical protein
MSKRTDNGIRIDPEIHALIPPLLKEEREYLRESLRREGCLQSIITWKDHQILLDGHNRAELCDELGIGYRVKELEFPNKNAAMAWVITNQFARRNLSAMQRVNLALRLEPLIAELASERRRGGVNLVPNSAQGRTDEILAEKAGVGKDTIQKGRKINGQAVPEIRDMATRGEVSINAAAKVAELPKSEQRAVAKRGPAAVKARATESATARESRNGSPPAVPTDHDGNEVPDIKRLRAIFADDQLISDLESAMTAVTKAKNLVVKSPAGIAIKAQEQQFDSFIGQARAIVRLYQFHAVCDECKGKGCSMCSSIGAVTRDSFDRRSKADALRNGGGR